MTETLNPDTATASDAVAGRLVAPVGIFVGCRRSPCPNSGPVPGRWYLERALPRNARELREIFNHTPEGGDSSADPVPAFRVLPPRGAACHPSVLLVVRGIGRPAMAQLRAMTDVLMPAMDRYVGHECQFGWREDGLLLGPPRTRALLALDWVAWYPPFGRSDVWQALRAGRFNEGPNEMVRQSIENSLWRQLAWFAGRWAEWTAAKGSDARHRVASDSLAALGVSPSTAPRVASARIGRRRMEPVSRGKSRRMADVCTVLVECDRLLEGPWQLGALLSRGHGSVMGEVDDPEEWFAREQMLAEDR